MTKTKKKKKRYYGRPCGCKYDALYRKWVKCPEAARLWDITKLSSKMQDRINYWKHFDNSF